MGYGNTHTPTQLQSYALPARRLHFLRKISKADQY